MLASLAPKLLGEGLEPSCPLKFTPMPIAPFYDGIMGNKQTVYITDCRSDQKEHLTVLKRISSIYYLSVNKCPINIL